MSAAAAAGADLYFIIVILLALSSLIKADNEIRTPDAMDEMIKDYTFRSLGVMKNRIKTGEIFNVDLPSNLSGIRANAARFRCGSLRRYGVQFDGFGLGVGLTLKPCLVRVMVIVQSLELNWSSIYYARYDLSGYELASPILGLTAYDYNATSIMINDSSYDPFEVGIRSNESNPIAIKFSNTTTYNNNTLCAVFEKDGTVRLTPPISPRVCSSTSDGHYGLVFKQPPPPPPKKKKAKRLLAVVASLAAIGLLVLILLVLICIKARKDARRAERERNADEGEYLPVSAIGTVGTLPVAGFTRTAPTLENELTF
ncbi:hypothetical protein LINGRAHAP2_LOCUS3352 [Linum grandiflorum]